MLPLFPVVYVAGPRQAGKSTLVHRLLHPSRDYFTMDNLQTLASAKSNPQEFIGLRKHPCVIDEIQRCPELLLPIKEQVDQAREKGMFLLTGSANLLSMPEVSDSLAGRMAIFELLPLSVQEILGVQKNWIQELFATPTPDVFDKKYHLTYEDICQMVINGGYPDVCQSTSLAYKHTWFTAYSQTMIERDLREISDYRSITRMHRLFALLALRSSCVINTADFARSSDIPASSVTLYINALESLFLIKRIPGYYSNRNKRLTKAPKIYFTDSGLMCHHLDIHSSAKPWEYREWGQIFETFVTNEIRKQLSWVYNTIQMYHYRTPHGKEVDLVLENKKQEIIGIEIKSSQNITPNMAKNFASLQEDAGDKFKIGLILYPGQSIEVLGDRIYAIPLSYIL